MKQIRNECNKAELVFQLDSRCYLPGWQQRQGFVLHSQLSGWSQSVSLQQYVRPTSDVMLQSHSSSSLSSWGWGGDVGSSASPDSHWCEGEKAPPQLLQFSSLLEGRMGEVFRADLIWPGPLSVSGEDGVAAGGVSRGGPCFILLCVFSPFSEAAL